MSQPQAPNLLFVDTETTGIDPADGARIVQLAAMLTDPAGKRLGQLCVLIEPDGWTVPPDAQRVHGISTDDCRAAGVPLRTAIETLYGLHRRAGLLVAHNMPFDRRMLVHECRGLGYIDNAFEQADAFCTMAAATPVCQIPGYRGDYKWPTLRETFHHFFGCGFDDAHDAMADVVACMRCYFELTKPRRTQP